MEYKGISSLLEKFKSLVINNEQEKNAIIASIFTETGIEIPRTAIKKHGTTLYVNISGARKTALFLKKESILAAINKHSKYTLLDIR